MAYIKIFEDGIFCSAACKAAWEDRGYGKMDEQEPDIKEEYRKRGECSSCGIGKPWDPPYRYLLVKPDAQLPSYLGFGFRICDDDQEGAIILEGPEAHARWQQQRLYSGLLIISGMLFESYGAAKAEQEMHQIYLRQSKKYHL